MGRKNLPDGGPGKGHIACVFVDTPKGREAYLKVLLAQRGIHGYEAAAAYLSSSLSAVHRALAREGESFVGPQLQYAVRHRFPRVNDRRIFQGVRDDQPVAAAAA